MTAPLPSMWLPRVRRRVLRLIHDRPGIGHDELATETGLSRTVITAALTALREAGRIRVGQPVDDGRARHYYPAPTATKETQHG